MLAQGLLRVQKSSKNHKMLLFVSWGNKCVISEWPPFDAPTSTHGVFTSFSLLNFELGTYMRPKVSTTKLYLNQRRHKFATYIKTFRFLKGPF